MDAFSRSVAEKGTEHKLLDFLSIISPAHEKLTSLLQSFFDGMQQLQEQQVQLVAARGLSSLPYEVLVVIFEMIIHEEPQMVDDWSTHRKVSSAIALSSVCQRFREIVLELPYVWNHICSDMGDRDIVKLCLNYSGNADLTVTIRANRVPPSETAFTYDRMYCIQRFLGLVLPHTRTA